MISVDSTVAIASLASPDSMFLLPGTRATVAIVSTAKVGDELMIVYSSGLSRIFDIAAQELRRSMDSKTAEGLLKEGNWVTWYVPFLFVYSSEADLVSIAGTILP